MSRVLVCGDIHGNYKALMQCLERSNFDYQNDTLISLGDVIDGHCDNFEVVEELLKIKNLIAVRGNHDDWFATWLQTGFNPSGWKQGQKATGLSYLEHSRPGAKWMKANEDFSGFEENISLMDIPASHVKFFKNQVSYHIDDKNRLFIHGGFDRSNLLEEQPEHNFWWDRDLWNDAVRYEMRSKENESMTFNMIESFDEIFIGHTSTQFIGVDLPVKAVNIYNLDQGAGGNGKLTIIDVDSKEFWQSDKGLELYPDFKGRG